MMRIDKEHRAWIKRKNKEIDRHCTEIISLKEIINKLTPENKQLKEELEEFKDKYALLRASVLLK